MDWIDRVSDIATIAIEGGFIILSLRFMAKMKASGAKVWQDMAEHLLLLAMCLLIAQIIGMFASSVVLIEHRLLVMMVGNLFYLGAAVFGYKMVTNLSKQLGRLLE